jgi:hypothetical protein
LSARNSFEITAIGAEDGARGGSGALAGGEIDTSSVRNGAGRRPLTRIFAGDTASRPIAIEKKSDASSFDRSPDSREVIRDGRPVAILEVAHGRNPDASSAGEFLLGPSEPPAGGSALLRAHAR